MYCSKCGRQLPDGVTVCPSCDPAPQVQAEVVNNQQKQKLFKAPDKFSKSYAALFTALLVFPATICTAIDLAFDKYDYWFGYVVGALIVTWVCAVLPFLRVTPPFVTALICFFSVIGYIFFIAGRNGNLDELYKVALPLMVLFAFFVLGGTNLIRPS